MARSVRLSAETLNDLSFESAPINFEQDLTKELDGFIFELEKAVLGEPISPCDPELDEKATATQIVLLASVLENFGTKPWLEIVKERVEKLIDSGDVSENLHDSVFYSEELNPEGFQQEVLGSVKADLSDPVRLAKCIGMGMVCTPQYREVSALVELDEELLVSVGSAANKTSFF